MASIWDNVMGLAPSLISEWYRRGPGSFWIVIVSSTLFSFAAMIYGLLYLAAPVPRAPVASEVLFSTIEPNGEESHKNQLPCWLDDAIISRNKDAADDKGKKSDNADLSAGSAEVLVSVVVPAFNEEQRLPDMLEDAVEFLDNAYPSKEAPKSTSGARQRKGASAKPSGPNGWEILIVSDGSTDKTKTTALNFAKSHRPGGSIRVISLVKNRGKGGAVLHGMRHVRGQYVIFADADGASKFADLAKLVDACDDVQDNRGRALAIGSRAHLVTSPAVVRRSALRNFLMRSFHLLIWLSTPPVTSQIKDTQCGFKLFTRQALPYIVPYVYSEGWIFDVEMLMLAERAGIPVKEVSIGWHEVKGSKLNVVWDSIGMAWTLLVLRAAWAVGMYRTEEDPASQESLEEFLKPNKNYLSYKNPPKLFG